MLIKLLEEYCTQLLGNHCWKSILVLLQFLQDHYLTTKIAEIRTPPLHDFGSELTNALKARIKKYFKFLRRYDYSRHDQANLIMLSCHFELIDREEAQEIADIIYERKRAPSEKN